MHFVLFQSCIILTFSDDGFCREGEQPGLKDFERVASVVEDLGHDKRLNITFLKVDRKGDPGAIRDFGYENAYIT